MADGIWKVPLSGWRQKPWMEVKERGEKAMKKIKCILSILWFAFVSLASPLWVGCIYMDITGHGKGYGYDMGSEADIAVLFGVVLLFLWLLAILPVTISLCKKACGRKQSLVWLPFLAFTVLFGAGICIIGWGEFIKLFGYGYPV